jgi:hypothetical protein
VRYSDAVAAAPLGSDRFEAADVARLGRHTLRALFAPGPSAPPLEDAAAALGGEQAALLRVASALPPARGERLLRLGQRPVAAEQRRAAGRRLVRGTFWLLTYELEPELWDDLASAEVISPELLADLPATGARVVDVAAGSGRLTRALAGPASALVAIEPCAPLRRLLRDRHPSVLVAAGVGHELPLRDGWADLVVSCATFGPHPPLGGESVAAELERVARPGGLVALVSPEEPQWWEDRGYEMQTYPEPTVELAPHLAAFFGPAHPPHVLLRKQTGAP